MTTASRNPQTILSPGTGAAGTTKGAPSATADSGWISLGSADGGDMMLSILNGASAPGSAGTIQIQVSPDATGARSYDYQSLTGDTNAYNAATSAGLTTIVIWIDPGIQYVRVFGYGNTTNPVTFGAVFSGVTRA